MALGAAHDGRWIVIELGERWRALKASRRHVRTRDAAAELGVTECELLATGLGETVTRLDGDMASLVHALPEVGPCMALTRNDSAVSEVRGTYGGVELGPHAGQVVGDGIDLRVFLGHWRHAFAVDEPHPQKDGERRRSIHVFDAHGVAVHKIYLEPTGDAAKWDAIVAARAVSDRAGAGRRLPGAARFPGAGAADHASALPWIEPPPAREVEGPDAGIDVDAFGADWDAMTDTHEFFFLLRKHRVSRTQALRLAGDARARRVRNEALGSVVLDAAEAGTRIMIFVGNRGCLQVFSGPVERIVRMGPWFNVLDPGFNLHLREDHIASSWVVKKPTRSGVVTSLELFDAAGETIALLFRKRDDREQAEDAAWGPLLDRLPEAR